MALNDITRHEGAFRHNLGNAYPVPIIKLLPSHRLADHMLSMPAPLCNGIAIGPIGNSDANPIITIEDLRGDGDHYACNVISSAFAGKNRVQQHQMVYKALGGRMGGELHALALQTSAPQN